MAVFTKEQRRLTKHLIETITGFEPEQENFKLCFEFAKSNFRFHRYLDVNDLKVTRHITGLCEKFHIHCQPEKAAALENLSEQFLDSTLEKSYPKSDAHYGTLLFLLCLSESPVNVDYHPPPATPPPHVVEDNFDWTSYLMEGIEYPMYNDSDSEWSDDDHSDSTSIVSKPELNDSAVGEELVDEGWCEGGSFLSESHSKALLLECVVTPYWDVNNPDYQVDLNSLAAPHSSSAHQACNMATTWKLYHQQQCESDPFFIPPPEAVTLTETQVVRETLWVLLGAEESFLYVFNSSNKRISVRRGVQVSHLTPLSLQRQLEQFSRLATMFYQLRSFCRSTSESLTNPQSLFQFEETKRGFCRCQTYEAFANGLHHCLEVLVTPLRELEKSIVERKKLVTLLSLAVELNSVSRKIHGLYEVFCRGVLELYEGVEENLQPPTWQCSSHLLNTLWIAIQHYDTLGLQGRDLLDILFGLWIVTIRPYLVILEKWLVCGSLDDNCNEFCIQRNDSANLWDEGYTLKKNSTPAFLQQSDLEKILLAGKSMNLIESIGKLKKYEEAKGDVSSATPPTVLYKEFLLSLKSELENTPSASKHESSVFATPAHDQEVVSLDKEAWYYTNDPLLRHYFTSQHVQSSTTVYSSSSRREWCDMVALLSSRVSPAPLFLLVQRTLSPLIHHRYHKASSVLLDLLRSQFKLTQHFKTVRMFFLMEAGPTIHYITSDIFQRIKDHETWDDPSYLNAVLHESLQATLGHSEDCSKLEKSLSIELSSPQHTVSSLSLRYDVPWPLDIVFSEPVMATYNQIFQLLLQVRWAKWSLEEIRTRACVLAGLSRELSRKLHLLHLLRANLLHFVNNLNDYLATRILHSVGLEFQQSVAEAEDLDSVISLHQNYTQTIFDRCLLNKKASLVKNAIMNVLGLALQFREKWEDNGVEHFSTSQAEKIESEFSKCIHFLVSCLKVIIKRGSFPHLETLAFSMNSLKTKEKIFAHRTLK